MTLDDLIDEAMTVARKSFVACLALFIVVAMPLYAQDRQPQHLRIVGGLAGVNQYTRHEEPFWTRQVPALSERRLTAEIVPFDRAGIRGQEMLRLMQLGVVPFGTVLLSLGAGQDAVLSAADLAGLNPDMASLKRHVGAFRAYLEDRLRERYGVKLLAVYVYPAQVVFCSKPIRNLAALSGLRVRTSSAAQSDLIEALGGVPIRTGFAEIISNMRSGNIECAITGTMSGNTIGLHEVSTHIHPVAINWGLSVFGANLSAWTALAPDMRELLQRELPKVEAAIWDESDRETGEGIACNIGEADCKAGRKGRMRQVPDTPQDHQLLREILISTVLPRWVQRCGPACVDTWNRTIGPAAGIEAQRH